MGMISFIGNVGSFVGPYLMGYVQNGTGSFNAGIYVLVGSLALAALLTTFIRERRDTKPVAADGNVVFA
jgi:nitrate/nitrite transporter NarK